MLIALHRAYAAAGRPGLRQISLGLKLDDSAPATLNYQAIGKILNGKQLPNPRQLASLALWLSREGNVAGQTDEDSKEFIDRLISLREAAHRNQLGSSDTHDELPNDAYGITHNRSTDYSPSEQGSAGRSNERKALGCMLLSKDALADVVEFLRVEDFDDVLHRAIYTTLLSFYSDGQEISIENVGEKLGTDISSHVNVVNYLHGLVVGAPDSREGERYAELVSDRSAVRRIAALGRKVSELAHLVADDENPDVDSLVRLVEDEILSLAEERDQISSVRDVLEISLDVVEAAGGSQSILGLASGFRDFDLLNSGFRPGELVIVGGASGMGKSTLGLNFIRSCSVARSHASFLISPQMGREEMMMRILAAEAGVAIHHMRSGSMTDDDWTRLARVMPSVADAPIYMVDEPSYTIGELVSSCKRLRRSKDLRLIVIDGIDLLHVDPALSSGDHERDLAVMVRELRKMAKELNLPVIALFNMRRPPERYSHHRPEVRDIPDYLESVADVVILLHREDAYERESPRAGEGDLIIAKNRNGPTAVVTAAFQGHYARFVDMSGA
ncbi:replicative DNA helicase [Streptomyces chartreusis]|uniref:replicative DNA helicase n=1 Tax=Streptomyces chartreusis TaxID=1969 RepID=UPI0033DDE961